MNQVSRRGFIAGAIATLATSGNTASAQKPGDNITGVLKKFELTNQNKEKFDASILAGKPYLLVLGVYKRADGKICPSCDEIAKTLGKIRKKYPGITIVAVNTKPDDEKGNGDEIVKHYKSQGVRDAQTLHVLFPESNAKAVEFQGEDGIKARFNEKDIDSHSLKIGVVDSSGKCVEAVLGTDIKNAEKVTSALNKLGQTR